MNIDETIRSVQAALGVTVDGKPGPRTWGAIRAFVIDKKSATKIKGMGDALVLDGGLVDSRSERNIATLLPHVRPYARALVNVAASNGVIIKVISGTRSLAEQAELFEKFKAGGPLAAPPGRSNHNYGIAFDVGVFVGSLDPEQAKNYQPESAAYDVAGTLASDIGLTWGGHWISSKDKPHYELRPDWALDLSESQMIDELARRQLAAIDPFAPVADT